MEDQISEFRIKVDGLAQLTKELKPYTQKGIGILAQIENYPLSKELEKAVDSLYLVKAWLGHISEMLKLEVNEDNALYSDFFPGGGYESGTYENSNHKEKINWIKGEISTLMGDFSQFYQIHDMEELSPFKKIGLFNHNTVLKHLIETSFFLDFELKRYNNE